MNEDALTTTADTDPTTDTDRGEARRPRHLAVAVRAAVGSAVFMIAAGAAGLMIAITPVATADTNPLVPYGTNPDVPSQGFHASNHDEVDTTNGFTDSPF